MCDCRDSGVDGVDRKDGKDGMDGDWVLDTGCWLPDDCWGLTGDL